MSSSFCIVSLACKRKSGEMANQKQAIKAAMETSINALFFILKKAD
jgi:hypothetical protein